ncbi:MAG: outer membrane protein assembly factor BamC, partial [Betaproteobacteria bacterium]|nr:outer membrane protein assembly factor BamC [Betaproteobacteria bacterium]
MLSRNLLIFSAVTGLLLAGCSFTGNKSTDYRSQGGKIPSLEVPPDLTSPVADDRFVIPDAKATTFSTYNRERGNVPVAGSTTVLPKVDNARIERAGEQRWLVVKATPDKLWPLVREFWTESGFALKRETPEAGIMETDWAENRAKIPQDLIRNTVGRFLDGLYETGYRDKFRTRLESGQEAGTTEVYISHRGVEEVYTNADKNSTAWQPRAADKELEAEMLTKLMVKFGYAAASSAVAAPAGSPAAASAVRAASFDKDKGGPLKVNEPFDRAWRRVGLALDRVGFTVEDRDRSKGLFFVRYIDPDAEAKSGQS